ncbi:FlgD immunoglobulin-like domain containing protein [Candidatus Poribacteria bacterium]
MRVTEKMVHTRLITNLQRVRDRLIKHQDRIATNRNIQKPSDDPTGFMKAMDYHRELYKLRQTVRNAESASLTLSRMDIALEAAGDLLLDARNRAVAMASDTTDADGRLAALTEVELTIEHMLQKANTELSGQYLFSGHKVFTQPYARQTIAEDSTVSLSGGGPIDLGYSLPADGDVTITIYDDTETLVRTVNVGTQIAGSYNYSWDGLDDLGAAAADGDYNYQVSVDFGDRIEYVGDQGLIEQKIELNASMVVSTPGSDAFGTSASGVFPALETLREALETNDQDGIRRSITALDTEINRIAEARGTIGMRVRRVEASMDELSATELMIAGSLSQIEDVDVVAEAAEYLATQEAYKATLESSGSSLKLPTLLDFLR